MYTRKKNNIVDEKGKTVSHHISINAAKRKSWEIQNSNSHEFDDVGKRGMGRGRIRVEL